MQLLTLHDLMQEFQRKNKSFREKTNFLSSFTLGLQSFTDELGDLYTCGLQHHDSLIQSHVTLVHAWFIVTS